MTKKRMAELTTGRRHMTKEQREQCVRLYQDGFSLKYLADFYDRHETIINRLIGRYGVRRGHVPHMKLILTKDVTGEVKDG